MCRSIARIASVVPMAYREAKRTSSPRSAWSSTPSRFWNTRYLSAAVDQLRAEGIPVKDEDVARLSPLGHAHINFLGRYAITASAPIHGLRDLGQIPDLPEGADHDWS